MKNNKGFTLVELLVSFTLSMILVIIMFQLIINLKEIYQMSGIKTELLNKQYLMTNKIYTDLTEKNLIQISKCDTEIQNCISLTFSNGDIKNFYADSTNGIISYDDYTIKLSNNSYISEVSINVEGSINEEGSNRILTIKVPVYNDLFKDENLGINIVYTYNDSDIINTYS